MVIMPPSLHPQDNRVKGGVVNKGSAVASPSAVLTTEWASAMLLVRVSDAGDRPKATTLAAPRSAATATTAPRCQSRDRDIEYRATL